MYIYATNAINYIYIIGCIQIMEVFPIYLERGMKSFEDPSFGILISFTS